jgi:hypothetical protein
MAGADAVRVVAVRDVVAHVISYDELDARGLLAHVSAAGSGRIRSTPPPWPGTTRAPWSNCWRC